MRVAIIATGVMELDGLAGCLAGVFPGHDFHTIAQREARPGQRAEPFSQSFTCQQEPGVAGEVPRNLTKIVQELAGQVYPRRRDAADMALVVDDLEIFNLHQPDVVVEAIHDAVIKHLFIGARLGPVDRLELQSCLRERASFHLAVPMTESWFFAGAQSLAPNGVPMDREPRLRAGTDPEYFETNDPDYSADDGARCAQMADRNRRRRESRRAPWIVAPQPDARWFTRERHPKHYLEWLCRDLRDNNCTTWRESDPGAAALRALDWPAVVANPAHCQFVRALLHDVADFLGVPAPFPAGGTLAPLTARKPRGDSLVLRNL